MRTYVSILYSFNVLKLGRISSCKYKNLFLKNLFYNMNKSLYFLLIVILLHKGLCICIKLKLKYNKKYQFKLYLQLAGPVLLVLSEALDSYQFLQKYQSLTGKPFKNSFSFFPIIGIKMHLVSIFYPLLFSLTFSLLFLLQRLLRLSINEIFLIQA